MPVVLGQNLGGYQVLEQVGQSGMATVYKGVHVGLSRQVAIKVLPVLQAESTTFLDRFRREAITVANLRHPNIPSIYDYGEEEDFTYIVSEYVEGGTLAEHLGAPMPPATCVSILHPIASALDYAHARGVIHRDVKPSNVLLTPDGRPLLSDFGIARIVGDAQGLTRAGVSMGTPEYMAPEHAVESEVGPEGDVYSLAVVAYQMLTGDVPYTGESPLAVILAHVHNPLPFPRDRNPALSDAIQEVLVKGLAKRPEDRYPSAGAFIVALDEAVAADSGGVAAIAALAPTEPMVLPPGMVQSPSTPAPPAGLHAKREAESDTAAVVAGPAATAGPGAPVLPSAQVAGTAGASPAVPAVSPAKRGVRPKLIGALVAASLGIVVFALAAAQLISREDGRSALPRQPDLAPPRAEPSPLVAELPVAAACRNSQGALAAADGALREGAPGRARDIIATVAACPGVDVAARLAAIDLLLGSRDAADRADPERALRLARELEQAAPGFPGLSDALHGALVGAGRAALDGDDVITALALCGEAEAARPGDEEAGTCLALAQPTPVPVPTEAPTPVPPPTPAPTPVPVAPTSAPATPVPTVPPQPTQPAQPTQLPRQAPPLVPVPSDAEAELLALINGSRADAGLPALDWSPAVAAAARAHTQEMVERGFFDSKNPEGVGTIERLREYGIVFAYWAENLSAANSVATAHAFDMSGESTRRNILEPRVVRVGIGIATRADRTLLIAAVFVSS